MDSKDLVKSILDGADIEPKLSEEIMLVGRFKKVSANEVLIDKDSPSNEIPFVLKGVLKVARHDDDGNMVFLYFLEGGETCAMSMTCCIEGKKAAFHVIAEEECLLWMVPMVHMDEWVIKYRSFRRFVFRSYQTRFDELLGTIDSVTFTNMDKRLYKYLLDIKGATRSYVIHKTHEQIATELNSSRVVVSRLLKQLEKEGKITQHRNKIEVM